MGRGGESMPLTQMQGRTPQAAEGQKLPRALSSLFGFLTTTHSHHSPAERRDSSIYNGAQPGFKTPLFSLTSK